MSSNLPQGPDVPLDFGGQQVPPNLGPILKWGGVIVALILLFALLSFLRTFYTDWLWFGVGAKIPGVSTNTAWTAPTMAMPITRFRVV